MVQTAHKPDTLGTISDPDVLEMRREVRSGKGKIARYYAEKHKVSINTIANALRGRSFKHLNEIEPPVIQDVRKLDKREEARQLASQRVPFKEIAKRLGVSKSSLHHWCGDIVKTRPNPERDAKREQAREMCRKEVPLEQIAKDLKISKNTAVAWCKDITSQRPEIAKRVTPAQIQEIQRLYVEEMMSTAQIEIDLGLCRSTVGRVCKGLAEQREARIKIASGENEKREEARRLYIEGVPYRELAKRLKISTSVLSLWCKDLTSKRDRSKVRQNRKRIGKINQPGQSAEHPYSDYYLFIYNPKVKEHPVVRLVHKETGARVTLSLPRYQMSVKEGRVLETQERVVCIRNKTDGAEEWTIVRKGEAWEHRKKDTKRTNTCPQCQETFFPTQGNYKKKYCSETCRSQAMSEQPRRPLPEFTRTCEICEEDFQTKNPRADVCRKQECKDVIAEYSG